MAKVLLVRSDASALSSGEGLPYPQGMDLEIFYTSQALRLYTQFPNLNFDLEFMLVPRDPAAPSVVADLQFYCEFFDDSTMQKDDRDAGRFPTRRLLTTNQGEAQGLFDVQDTMGWSEETEAEQSRLEFEGRYDTKLRLVKLQTYNPRVVSIKLNAPHLWTHIRYRMLTNLNTADADAYSLYVWGVLGGFSEEKYLEGIVNPYGYESRS